MTPRLGIVGAGQLARMMYEASLPLGVVPRILAAAPGESAALVAAGVTVGSPDSLDELSAFAGACDVVTFDHELVDPAHLEALERDGHVLRPGAAAKRFGQDKAHQRRALGEMGMPVPPWGPVATAGDVGGFADRHGWPVVLKAARGGYDGRGVWVVDGPAATGQVLAEAARRGLSLIAEAHMDLERELAVLVARRPAGDAVAYPVIETVQVDGILREALVPAAISPALEHAARTIGLELAATIGSTGVLAVELFLTGDGDLLVNELALRPHNSGHLSIEGCLTSQFENHVRGVLDLPLGSPAPAAPAAACVNVLGGDVESPESRLPRALAVEGAAVHLYGKPWRPRRKLGHVTAVGAERSEARERARQAAAALGAAVTAEAMA